MESEKNVMKFWVNNDNVVFEVGRSMEMHRAYASISMVNIFDIVEDTVKLKLEEEILGIWW